LALGGGRVIAQETTQSHLEQVYRHRQHVKYRYGGCTETLMDCSCFVQRTFRDAFGLNLPRSTLRQANYFKKELVPGLRSMRQLGPASLCPGDLIYTYRKGSWPTSSRHVAIYFGDGKILHSARRVGVVKQPLGVLSHHQLHGVVRLFECRRSDAEQDDIQPQGTL
jgi:lipoprotein Spr